MRLTINTNTVATTVAALVTVAEHIRRSSTTSQQWAVIKKMLQCGLRCRKLSSLSTRVFRVLHERLVDIQLKNPPPTPPVHVAVPTEAVSTVKPVLVSSDDKQSMSEEELAIACQRKSLPLFRKRGGNERQLYPKYGLSRC